MFNWRLLLFAFFAFFQPIATFTERNIVDGRQKCCDHRLSRDTRSLYDNHPFQLSYGNRHLNFRRDVSRDDFRNKNALLFRTTRDSHRDLREREVINISPEPMTRLSRTESRRMSSRDSIPEQRVRVIRDLHRNHDERDRVLDDSRARQIRITYASEHHDVGAREYVVNHNRRTIQQREERRLKPTNIAESRMFRGIQTTRGIRQELNRANQRITETDILLGQSTRLNNLERSNERDFSRRNENQRSSLERFSRTIGSRILPSEGLKSKTDELKTKRENVKMERINNPHEIRVIERVDLSRKPSSQPIKLERYDNSRDRVLRQRNELRDSSVRQELRNDDRGYERRVTKERINSEHFLHTPTTRIELRRIELNRERESEHFTARSRTFDKNSRSQMTIRTRSMDINNGKEVERENGRMDTPRLSRQLREIVNSEHRQTSKDDRKRDYTDLSRIQARDEKSERRKVDSQRRYLRSYDESRKQRDESRELFARRIVRERTSEAVRLTVRREVRERTRSLEGERIVRGERRIAEMRYETDSRRNYGERHFGERTSYENGLTSLSLAASDMPRERNFDQTSDVSRMRRQLIDNRVKISRSDLSEMNYNNNYLYVDNWQYLMYALQAIYLCTIIVPLLLAKSKTSKKSTSIKWCAPFQKLIKVD